MRKTLLKWYVIGLVFLLRRAVASNRAGFEGLYPGHDTLRGAGGREGVTSRVNPVEAARWFADTLAQPGQTPYGFIGSLAKMTPEQLFNVMHRCAVVEALADHFGWLVLSHMELERGVRMGEPNFDNPPPLKHVVTYGPANNN